MKTKPSFKSSVKKMIYACIPARYKEYLRQEIFNEHAYFKHLSVGFSQEGEDQIIAQYFYNSQKGFYVDIGAYHPIKYSNTYKFYLRGWRGINIDAMPGSMVAFQKIRPEDISIEAGVASTENTLFYHIFDQTGINTFSEEFALDMICKGYTLSQRIMTKTYPLKIILDNYLPAKQPIDFLSIDVEGFELDVLVSNDWSKYRPKLVIVESLRLKNKPVLDNYLEQVGYGLTAQTINNLYYVDRTINFC